MTRQEWKDKLHLIQAFVEGKELEVISLNGDWKKLILESPCFDSAASEYRIKPSTKPRTIEDGLEVGDILIDESEDSIRVLGITGEVIITSSCQDHQSAADLYTLPELIKYGFALQDNTKDSSKTIEVTLEEVAKLKGVSVESIRIKE